MGSSNKKKKEKAKDFAKPKFKVGKAKAKPANFTDTSFKAKSIVMGQQSLSTEAPDAGVQFKHQLSLASTSRSEKQRKESLAHLTSQVASGNNPIGTANILSKLLPLISDAAGPVRSQLLKLFRALPEQERNKQRRLICSRMASGCRGGADWLDECTENGLEAGLKPEMAAPRNPNAYTDNICHVPRTPNPFAYLNLFGTRRDEEAEMYNDRESRQRVFHRRFLDSFTRGIAQSKKEGGATGRSAITLEQALKEGMGEYEPTSAVDTQDLLDLW
ncbi:Pre-rRNA-processing protein IPI1 [Colletotrichum orbiculare MAFF 240422]|uniref:Pre-rRNA-processing protein n=1 Tax=Colletotrichum orbiculare (strain 104-T / ATCC 96160 / CBS 514.97 / LARS 414 / MAFF 240422) TaxID=1213857 RepID=A0A484FUD5_COLOR|nr:Pre-rRNA-processing protein IPI1 [Colletotrichum orbiculare MAFF 240422]